MPKLVLTLLADDKPGLVRAVSDCVVSHGGNWLESRMAQLAGKFAGVVLVEVAEDQQSALEAALAGFTEDGISIAVTQAEDAPAKEGEVVLTLIVDGADHPGIVHQVTDLLLSRQINIRELESNTHAAAMSGQPIFAAEIQAVLPQGLDRAALEKDLQSLAGDLLVDIDVQD